MTTLEIQGFKLVCTCPACPEQYNVFDAEENQVGYIRLRHGHLTAEYPDCSGMVVLTSLEVDGDGEFRDWEREYWLNKCVQRILWAIQSKLLDVSKTPS